MELVTASLNNQHPRTRHKQYPSPEEHVAEGAMVTARGTSTKGHPRQLSFKKILKIVGSLEAKDGLVGNSLTMESQCVVSMCTYNSILLKTLSGK